MSQSGKSQEIIRPELNSFLCFARYTGEPANHTLIQPAMIVAPAKGGTGSVGQDRVGVAI